MKLALALLALAVACLPAAAAPCPAGGTPILEIDHDAIPNAKKATWQVKLYDSGAWTTVVTGAEPRSTATRGGCLAKDELAKVKADLAAAKWTVHHARFHCQMMGLTYDVYKVGGKTVWTAKVCSGDSLDDASQKAVTDLQAVLTGAKALPT